MLVTTPPDAEGASRTYLRAQTSDRLVGRVFFDVPLGNPTFPLATVSLLNLVPQQGEAPLFDAHISMDVWGQSKKDAIDATLEIVGVITGIRSVLLDAATFGYNGQVDSVIWLPQVDVDRRLARYVIDATLTVRSA